MALATTFAFCQMMLLFLQLMFMGFWLVDEYFYWVKQHAERTDLQSSLSQSAWADFGEFHAAPLQWEELVWEDYGEDGAPGGLRTLETSGEWRAAEFREWRE